MAILLSEECDCCRPGKIQIKKSHMTVKVTEVPQSIRQRLISSAKRKKK